MSRDKEINIPYNLKNKLVVEQDIINILAKFNIFIKVKDLSIYQLSLTHKSYINRNFKFTDEMLENCNDYNKNVVPLQKESFERLEFFGDRVIDKLIVKYLYLRFPNDDEGFMTQLKTKLVDCKMLGEFAKEIGLLQYILISKQVENIDNGTGRASVSFRNIAEDSFEAFMGALDTDAGEEICQKLLFALLETHVDFAELLNNDNNYKTQLQGYYHKMGWSHPIYKLVDDGNEGHRESFTMCVCDNNDIVIGQGTSNKKKYGEQAAAKAALQYLGLISEDPNVDIINKNIFI
jgi:ribonuclease-3